MNPACSVFDRRFFTYFVIVISMSAAAAPSANSVAKAVGQLRATRTGVDPAGNFWAWNAEERHVTSIAPSGARRTVQQLPEASAVDADASRGILALTDSGGVVTVFDWTGQAGLRVSLTNPASNVCWLSGDEFAVAPLFATHLVEVWNLRTGKLARTMVAVPAVLRPARGAVLARTTLLRYDWRRGELITVDAVTGAIRVLRSDGQVLRTAQLPGGAAALRPWLDQVNADAQSRGESNVPSIWHYSAVTVADDGAIWVGEEYDETSIRAARVTRAGKVEHRTLAEPCPSLRFEAWQKHFILYQHPRSPRPPCVGVRRQ